MKKTFKQTVKTFLLGALWIIFIGAIGAFCFFTLLIFRVGWQLAQHVTIELRFNFP